MGDNPPMARGRFPAFAAAGALLAVVVVFFPSLFFGRVISPLDTVANAAPWRAVHPPVEVANPDLEEAATAVLPLQLMARRTGFATALWNPYLACGGPGWLVWSAGILSPTVGPLLPWIEEARLPGAIVLLRLLAAFWGCWLLLRRFELSGTAAAIGAAAFALSGPMTAGWLWPAGGTVALLPLALWSLDRALGRDAPPRAAAVFGLAWLAFLAGGAPGPTVAGFWLLAAWTARRFLTGRPGERPAPAQAAAAGAAAAAGTAVLLPPILLWWRSAAGWGLLNGGVAEPALGLDTVRMLVDPFLFGDPRTGTFTPPAGLEGAGFHDLCLAVGPVVLALALVGAAHRRAPAAFWAGTAAAVTAAIAWAPASRAIRLLPGLGHVSPLRLAPLLALALAALAGLGWDALERLVHPGTARPAAAALLTAVVLQQGLLAGHLTTSLRPAEAHLGTTPSLTWLENAVRPGDRIAPLFHTLPPDTPAALGLNDIRSRFASLEAYRRLVRRIDPQSWDPHARRIVLNGATIDLLHPYLAALGARWILEPPAYHLVEYALGEGTVDTGPRRATLGPLRRGARIEQAVTLPARCSRLGLGLRLEDGASARFRIRLAGPAGEPVARWDRRAGEENGGGVLWLDLPRRLPRGPLRLEIRCREVTGALSLWTAPPDGKVTGALTVDGRPRTDALVLTLDTSGYAVAHEGPDLRIWENRNALPLLWTVDTAVPGSLDTLLDADPPLDLATTAVVAPGVPAALSTLHRGTVGPVTVRGSTVTAPVAMPGPGLLVSSIPASPPVLAVEIDGRPAPRVTVDGLFLGVFLPAGRHRVAFVPRLAPWQWGPVAAGCGILAALALPWRRRRGTA